MELATHSASSIAATNGRNPSDIGHLRVRALPVRSIAHRAQIAILARMSAANSEPVAVHNEAQSRFEFRLDGWLCRCDYRLVEGVMHLVHTEVPPLLEGRGLAARLVRAALDHARAQGLKVAPRCSYVRTYLQRHPQDQDLVA